MKKLNNLKKTRYYRHVLFDIIYPKPKSVISYKFSSYALEIEKL